MIVGCAAVVALLLLGKPTKMPMRIVKSGVVGGVFMIILNAVLYPFGIFVGINVVTLVVAGMLGIPGVLLLYVSAMVL
jgi:inhibitor of the pro-sigma K processing machinery